MAHFYSSYPDSDFPGRQFFLCKICQQTVPLETCKTDERGQPVHERCYLGVVSQGDMQEDGREP